MEASKRENVFAMRGKAQGNENELKCMSIRHNEKLITMITTRFWCDIKNLLMPFLALQCSTKIV